MITAEYLRRLLHYDPGTGVFRWKIWGGERAPAGTTAGSMMALGYSTICIDSRHYLAHRLAWLYMTGDWPVVDIDHANLDKADNRWSHLREATRAQNKGNESRRSSNTTGAKGVYWHRQNRKWIANIRRNGKQTYLGSFATRDEAAAAYAAAAKEHFGEFARTE